ncbi:flagellar assembly protein FliW [Pelosinus sp. UFO1]|uniref:flagellar assembly protein FliW n=1 Tax=Pelosinus sp. UFO1 TaxID=484770 RepID=UPI0004D19ECC|nr:flagellar assembly protein FliW [Pelosinus sp. UFO1]AIF53657.1 Flagellar assembly factor fliW [Pelosinus sp. UFO1]
MDKSEQPKKIHFPKGLIGLENYRNFSLTELPDQTMFWLLQSLEDEDFGLVVTNPFWFMPDYEFQLDDVQAEQVGDNSNLGVFVTVNVASTPEKITANLMGPIVVNQNTGIACQVLVSNKNYTLQYNLMAANLAGG